jgi:hypothetical protein
MIDRPSSIYGPHALGTQARQGRPECHDSARHIAASRTPTRPGRTTGWRRPRLGERPHHGAGAGSNPTGPATNVSSGAECRIPIGPDSGTQVPSPAKLSRPAIKGERTAKSSLEVLPRISTELELLAQLSSKTGGLHECLGGCDVTIGQRRCRLHDGSSAPLERCEHVQEDRGEHTGGPGPVDEDEARVAGARG